MSQSDLGPDLERLFDAKAGEVPADATGSPAEVEAIEQRARSLRARRMGVTTSALALVFAVLVAAVVVRTADEATQRVDIRGAARRTAATTTTTVDQPRPQRRPEAAPDVSAPTTVARPPTPTSTTIPSASPSGRCGRNGYEYAIEAATVARNGDVWIGSYGDSVAATDDGGRTWRVHCRVLGQDRAWLDGLEATSATEGWAWFESETHQAAAARTTDGGATWVLTKPGEPRFQSMGASFPSTTVGWVWGATVVTEEASPSSPKLYRTADRGESWTEVTLPEGVGARVYDAAFVDAEQGWVSSEGNGPETLYRTGDGGRTWSPVELPSDVNGVLEMEVAGNDLSRLYVVANTTSGQATILSTRDGGDTWSRVAVAAGHGNVAAVTADVAVFAPGAGGPLLRTTDGGVNWVPALVQVPKGHLHIDASGGRHVVVGAGEHVLLSGDAGLTWQQRKT